MVSRIKKKGIIIPIVFVICAGMLFSTNMTLVAGSPETTYTQQFRLENVSTRYYVASLELNETWSINCTGLFTGKFYLYLFQDRPLSSHMLENGSIDPEILNVASVYNITPSAIFSDVLNDTVCSTSLEFEATTATLYYLQIILVEGGPDTFVLSSSVEFQAYYIPFIAGYPGEILLGIVILSSGILFQRTRKKRKV